MSLLWVTATEIPLNQRQWYHLSEDPDWQPDPEHRPNDVYADPGAEHMKGLFVTDKPDHWKGWGSGKRHVHPLDIPAHVIDHPETGEDTYQHELFIPGHLVHHVRRQS